MKKIILFFSFLLLSSIFVCSPQNSQAYPVPPVSVDQHIKFANGPGTTNGGEFMVSDWYSGAYIFNTFCIEMNEHINYGVEFVVSGITDSAVAGGIAGATDGKDPISPETAYLYHNFFFGTLADYDYLGTDRPLYANDLQNAIWFLENEITTYTYVKKDYVTLAQNAGWTDIGDVRAINLTYAANGNRAQDQLTIAPVPEPATMLLLGVGLCGLAFVGRKKLIKQG